MIKFLDRLTKRRVQQHSRVTNKRKFVRGLRSGLEGLEERRLLAVVSDGNFGQMFTPNTADGVTQAVRSDLLVGHGADAAIIVVANYTASGTTGEEIQVDIEFDDDADGVFGELGDDSATITRDETTGLNQLHLSTYAYANVDVPSSMETINSAIFVIPIGSNAMDRSLRVSVSADTSTDILATVGSARGIDQTAPIIQRASGMNNAVNAGLPLQNSILNLPVAVTSGNLVVDGLGARFVDGATEGQTGLNPGTFVEAAGPQSEQLDAPHTIPTTGKVIRGASSLDDDRTVAWTSAGPAHMFAYVHGVVEIGMTTDPTTVLYDAGDAPESYSTSITVGGPIHAPKGPTIGPARDAEANGQPSPLSNADDIAGIGDDEDGLISYHNTGMDDDESLDLSTSLFATKRTGPTSGDLTLSFDIPAGQTAYVTAYLDWNNDGDYLQNPGDDPTDLASLIDAGELILAGVPVVGDALPGVQTQTFTITIPAESAVGFGAVGDPDHNQITPTLRVRLHTDMMSAGITTLPVGGHANDGEIEDHRITIRRSGEIHGLKLEDINGDGDGAGDPAFSNIPIAIWGNALLTSPVSDLFGNPISSTVTDANGEFRFDYLDPALTYFVSEELDDPSGVGSHSWADLGVSVSSILPDAAGVNGPAGADPTRPYIRVDLDLADGFSEDTVFLNYVDGSIHGFKYNDVDGDGVFEPLDPDLPESALPGVTFNLYRYLGSNVGTGFSGFAFVSHEWELVASEVTDAHGEFWFTGLAPGQYVVRESLPGWVQTTQQGQGDPTLGAGFYRVYLGPSSPSKFVPISAIDDDGEISAQLTPGRQTDGSTQSAAILGQLPLGSGSGHLIRVDNGTLSAKGYILRKISGASHTDIPLTVSATSSRVVNVGSEGGVWQLYDATGTTTIGGTMALGSSVNPADLFGTGQAPGADLLTIASRDELQWENDAFEPPNFLEFAGPAYTRPMDGMGGPLDGLIDQGEIDWAIELATLKNPITQPLSGPTSLVWGNYLPVDITGYKYEDTDGSGGYDAGEQPFDGITFELVTAGGSVVATAISGADPDGPSGPLSAVPGKFWFLEVAPGEYLIREAAAQDSNGDGVDDVGEYDGTDGQGLVLDSKTVSFTVISGGLRPDDAALDLDNDDQNGLVDLSGTPAASDFAPWLNYVTGSIHGLKFEDFNGNGNFNPVAGVNSIAEVGLPGIVFELYRFVGTNTYDLGSNHPDAVTYEWELVDTVTSDEHGEFWFTGLVPGQYTVREVLDGTGFEQSSTQAQGDPRSEFDVTNFDPDDLPFLGDAPSSLGNSLLTVTSRLELQWDSDATFEGFPAYEGNAYQRPMDTLAPFGVITQAEIDAALEATALKVGSAAMASLRWGNIRPVDIMGYKYEDANGNGEFDAGEQPFDGITFELVGNGGIVVATAVSGADPDGPSGPLSAVPGKFWFLGVAPGTYTVRETALQDSNDDDIDDVGEWDGSEGQGLVLDSKSISFTIISGGLHPDDAELDFDGDNTNGMVDLTGAEGDSDFAPWLNYVTGSIHGFKFDDLDGDGVFEPLDATLPESALPGVTFNLYRYLGSSVGTGFSGFAFVTHEWELVDSEVTNVHGEFWFTGLAPGQYVVRESLPGWSQSTQQGQGNPNLGAGFYKVYLGPTSPSKFVPIGAIDDDGEISAQLAPGRQVNNSIQGAAILGQLPLGSGSGHLIRVDNGTLSAKSYILRKISGVVHADIPLTVNSNSSRVVNVGSDGGVWQLYDATGTTAIGGTMTLGITVNPLDLFGTGEAPGADLLTIASRNELQWENNAFEPPNFLEYEGPAYTRPIDGMGGPLDGLINQSERDAALAKAALKNPVTQPLSGPTSLVWGNYLPVDIMGYKYEDANGDGDFDLGELPFDGITFELVGAGGAVVATAVSGADPDGPSGPLSAVPGKFWFLEVAPGEYLIREAAAQDSNGDGVDDVGEYDGTDGQGLVLDSKTVSFTVISGGLHPDDASLDLDNDDTNGLVDLSGSPEGADFAPWMNYVTGSIHGLKFHDRDNDGVFEPSANPAEQGLAGITFQLYRFVATHTYNLGSNHPDAVTYEWELVDSTTSDEHGEYWFTGLAPGRYTVREVLAGTNYTQSTGQAEGDPRSEFDENNFDPDNLPFLGDAPSDASVLVISSRDELQWDDDTTFEGFPAYEGHAYERPMDTLAPFGVITQAEVDAALNASALKNGSSALSSLRWGNFLNATISGFKYEDLDGDGVKDGPEPGFAGIQFELVNSLNTVVQTVATDATGLFTFTNVIPGSTYTIREKADQAIDAGVDDELTDDPLVVRLTVFSGNNINVTTNAGVAAVNNVGYEDDGTTAFDDARQPWLNFVYGSVHGVKFEDLNADGDMDAGEPRLRNVEFTLQIRVGNNWVNVAAANNPAFTGANPALTDVNGEFSFTNLVPGEYRLIENLATGNTLPAGDEWVSSTHTFNVAGASGSFVIESREEYVWRAGEANLAGNSLKREELLATSNSSLIYGNYLPVDIMGYKYEDVNGNGVYDAGIDGAYDSSVFTEGFTFVLLDVNGNVVDTVQTDASGKFTFEDVVPGLYTVREALEQDSNDDGVDDVGEYNLLTGDGQGLVLDSKSISFTVISGGLATPDRPKDLDDDNHDAMVDLTGAPADGDFAPWLNYVTGSIHGLKFLDYDRDGVFEPGPSTGGVPEIGLSGVRFDLYRFVDTHVYNPFSNVTFTTYEWEFVGFEITDAHGEFWFTGLQPGTYTVRETETGEFEQTTPWAEGNPDADSFTGNTPPAFRGDNPALLSTNALVIESRDELQWDDNTVYTTTPYIGQAYVRPMDTRAPFGLITQAERDDATKANALKVPSAAVAELMFGNNYIAVEIHGFKFHDIDGDGIWDRSSSQYYNDAEPGLENILVGLIDQTTGEIAVTADGVSLAIAQSMSDGQFWFDNLIPNRPYLLVEFLNGEPVNGGSISDSNYNNVPDGLEGMFQTTNHSPVVVPPGQSLVWNANPNNILLDLVIGNTVTGSIHGFKFEDINVDGIYQPIDGSHDGWDVPMEWAVFQLLDASGAIVDLNNDGIGNDDDTVMTNLDGEFWFENLAPGRYTVRERLDLIDRNDLFGPFGGPADGLPDGNGIPDIDEGLGASTPTEFTLTILSGQEYVWAPGAAHLDAGVGGTTHSLNPDSLPGVSHGQDISNAFPNVTLSSNGVGPVYAVVPLLASPPFSAGGFVYGSNAAVPSDANWSFSAPINFVQADFDVAVTSVSVDIIAESASDQGEIRAFDSDGNLIDQKFTTVMSVGQTRTLTVNAPNGTTIARVRIGGAGVGKAVGVDNLVYKTTSLKQEVVAGGNLQFGNFYAGAVHGTKLQQGSGLPAPGIVFRLVDMNGVIRYTATTDADGRYEFLDVRPGMYSLVEVASPSVLSTLINLPITVPYATSVVSALGTGAPYPGLQTELAKPQLAVTNFIAGSVHGMAVDGSNNPLAGVTFKLTGKAGFTRLATTGADGQFHFEDIDPRNSWSSGTFIVQPFPAIDGIDPVGVLVQSGEEHAAMVGQTNGLLDPGQFEVFTPELAFRLEVGGGLTIDDFMVNSTTWTPLFRDFIDGGFNDGPSLGALNDGVARGYHVQPGESLPWTSLNQIKVQFSGNVSASLSVNDFILTGDSGYDQNFAVGVVPVIIGVSFDSTHNMATLQLHTDMGPNRYQLKVLSAGIQTPGGDTLVVDQTLEFHVLPGDVLDNHATSSDVYIVNGPDVNYVRDRQAGFLFDQLGASAFDGAYFNYDPRADINGDGQILGPDVNAARDRQSSFVFVVVPSPALAASGPDDEESQALIEGGEPETLIGEGEKSPAAAEVWDSYSDELTDSFIAPADTDKYADEVDEFFAGLEDDLLAI